MRVADVYTIQHQVGCTNDVLMDQKLQLAISGVELINQWYHDPTDFAIMSDCANTRMGVWSENSLDRTVVVAVYGQQQ